MTVEPRFMTVSLRNDPKYADNAKKTEESHVTGSVSCDGNVGKKYARSPDTEQYDRAMQRAIRRASDKLGSLDPRTGKPPEAPQPLQPAQRLPRGGTVVIPRGVAAKARARLLGPPADVSEEAV